MIGVSSTPTWTEQGRDPSYRRIMDDGPRVQDRAHTDTETVPLVSDFYPHWTFSTFQTVL